MSDFQIGDVVETTREIMTPRGVKVRQQTVGNVDIVKIEKGREIYIVKTTHGTFTLPAADIRLIPSRVSVIYSKS